MTNAVPMPSGWPGNDLAVHRRATYVGNHKISYVTGGHGPAVLLLHGIGASSYAWRHALPLLAQHFTVYAPDMLGCGESDKPDIDYDVATMTEYLCEFMDNLGITHAHFVGHSLGGGMTLHFYSKYPERMDRVALISPGGLGRAVHWLLRASTLPGADGVLGAISHPGTHLSQASRALERRRMRRLDVEFDDSVPNILDRLHSAETRTAFLRMVRHASGLHGQKLSVQHLLATFDKDVLIIWGANDRTIPMIHGVAAARIMPRAKLVILPNCFHRPPIEAPGPCNDELMRFLLAPTWPPTEQPIPISTLYPPDVAKPFAAYDAFDGDRAPWYDAFGPHARWRRLAPAALAIVSSAASASLLANHRRRLRRAARR